ncbi:MAG: hypothetical protein NC489_29665, partial [Ruminococcus flavefaciens]|nr:hypothetical protein [Ruminococcus flavefaciens]
MGETVYGVTLPTITDSELEEAKKNGTLEEYLADINKKHHEAIEAAGIHIGKTQQMASRRNGGIPKMVFHETRETEHSSVTDGLP